MAADTSVGTIIRRARERKRMTQQELADAVDVNVRTVRNWEHGNVSSIRNRIGAVEQVLGISLDGEDEPTLSAEELEQKHRDLEATLEAALAQLRGGNGEPKSA